MSHPSVMSASATAMKRSAVEFSEPPVTHPPSQARISGDAPSELDVTLTSAPDSSSMSTTSICPDDDAAWMAVSPPCCPDVPPGMLLPFFLVFWGFVLAFALARASARLPFCTSSLFSSPTGAISPS